MADCVVTLLTDFGSDDPYVAEVKGRFYQEWARFPVLTSRPVIVDLSHGLPPGDVAAAAWFLERVHAGFPLGTVHLAVVDPGVGTQRPGLAIAAAGQFFVGPGNGLFSFLLDSSRGASAGGTALSVHFLDNPLYHRGAAGPGEAPSATFHGRDIFAPAAAHLAAGVPLAQLGRAVAAEAIGRLPPAPPGRVVWLDRFGNALTDLRRDTEAGRALATGGTVCIGSLSAVGPVANYEEGPSESPFWYWGSGETLEVAVRRGSAAARFGLRVGMAVTWRAP